MKRGIFWKVIISLVVLWLFLFLWMNQWHYYQAGLIKINRITGKVYQIEHGKWKALQQTDDK